MEPEEYKKMYQLEESHWWFVSKRRLVRSFFKRAVSPNSTKILDLGCGTGANLKSFSSYGKGFGVDISPLAIKFSSMRGCRYLVRASINALPFKDNIFDVVTLLDVLYHKMVEEDKKALSEVYKLTKQGGKIIITDSALKGLRSSHDIVTQGRRRYNKRDLRQLVRDAGFKIERLTYTNFFLFPFICTIRLWKRFFVRGIVSSDLKPVDPILNYILLIVQIFERFLLKVINLPIGSSILCVARKQVQS